MIGIYIITNKINNKVYVGQSWNAGQRWIRHQQNSNRKAHKDEHFYRSINKYGLINFEFQMLKELVGEEATQENLDKWEDYYITLYNSRDKKFGYNKKTGGSHEWNLRVQWLFRLQWN